MPVWTDLNLMCLTFEKNDIDALLYFWWYKDIKPAAMEYYDGIFLSFRLLYLS